MRLFMKTYAYMKLTHKEEVQYFLVHILSYTELQAFRKITHARTHAHRIRSAYVGPRRHGTAKRPS